MERGGRGWVAEISQTIPAKRIIPEASNILSVLRGGNSRMPEAGFPGAGGDLDFLICVFAIVHSFSYLTSAGIFQSGKQWARFAVPSSPCIEHPTGDYSAS